MIEVALDKAGIGYQRLDGESTPTQREEAIENMRDDPDSRVFLVCAISFKMSAKDNVHICKAFFVKSVFNY